AEDGIRDGHVTGVQTCALPIFGIMTGPFPSPGRARLRPSLAELGAEGGSAGVSPSHTQSKLEKETALRIMRKSGVIWLRGSSCRSEERRVGKESSVRGATNEE